MSNRSKKKLPDLAQNLRISHRLTKDKDSEDLDKFLTSFKNCQGVRKEIAEALTSELNSSILSMKNREFLKNCNLTERLLSELHFQRGLETAIKLIHPEDNDE